MGNAVFTRIEQATDVIGISVVRSVAQVAPEGLEFHFDMSGAGFDETGDALLTEVEYKTTFSEDYDFTASSNITAIGKQAAHIVRGPKPIFVSRAGGTLNVNVEAWGKVGGVRTKRTGSTSITIGDTSSWVTYWVSPNGLTAGQPAGSTLFTSLTAALNAAHNQTDPRLIVLNSADTWPTFGGYGVGFSQAIGHLHIVASGAPIDMDASGTGLTFNYNVGANERDFVLQGVNFDGGYRAATTGAAPTNNGLDIQDRPPTTILVDNCSLQGFYFPFTALNGQGTDARLAIINDTSMTDWYHIGVQGFRFADRFGMAGCSVACDPAALMDMTDNGGAGGRGDVPFTEQACEWYPRIGWTNLANGRVASQAGNRVRSDGEAGFDCYISDSIYQGGYDGLNNAATEPSLPSAGTVVMDGVYGLSGHQMGAMANINQGSHVMRNCITVWPAISSYQQDPQCVLRLRDTGAGDPERDAPVRMVSCTTINRSSHEVVQIATAYGTANTFRDVAESNNAIYQDAIGSPQTSDGPFDLTGTAFTALDSGYFTSTEASFASPVAGTTTPANSVPMPYPQTGGGAYEDATTGDVAALDFFMRERGSTPSRGALEPA